jgi:TatA/E family protein of Tat protein translocase
MINLAVWTPGFGELIIILVVVLIIFGPKNLPKLARAMGRGIKEFKDATKGISQDVMDDDEEVDPARLEKMKKEEEKRVEPPNSEKKESQDKDG